MTIANLCRLKRLNAMKTGSMPGMSVTTPILGVSVSVLCPNYSQDQRRWPRCVSRKVARSPWLPVWRNAGPFVQRRPSECSSPQLLIYLLSTYFQCKNVDIFAIYGYNQYIIIKCTHTKNNGSKVYAVYCVAARKVHVRSLDCSTGGPDRRSEGTISQ